MGEYNIYLPSNDESTIRLERKITHDIAKKAEREFRNLRKWGYLSVRASKFRTRKKYARKMREYFAKYPFVGNYLYIPGRITVFGRSYKAQSTFPVGIYGPWWQRTPCYPTEKEQEKIDVSLSEW